MPGVPAKCRISATGDFYSFMNIGLDGLDIRTVGLLLGGVRGDTGTRGYDDFCPGVFSDEFDIVIPDNIVQALQNYRAGKGNAELKIRVRNQAEMQNHVLEDHGGNSKTPNQVPLEDVHLGYASLWANPTEPPVALIKISAYGRDNAVYSYRWTEDCGPEGATSTVVVNEPPLPDLPPDKVEEGKLHQANIGAIRTRLAQDEAELANAKDRDTRANLQRKIIGDKTDLLAEQDLLTSLE
jgi:hypothetical protein